MTNTAELERLAASITPGPWVSSVEDNGDNLIVKSGDIQVVGGCGCCGSAWTDEDCAQANSRAIALVPDLLAEVIAMRAEVARLKNENALLGELKIEAEVDEFKAEARANAAEADAERLAEALDAMGDVCNSSLGDAALAAHTQRVNAKEDTQ